MSKQKIGILTTSDTINYGACLQTYALQRHLRTEGVDVEVIDFRPEAEGRGQSPAIRVRSFVWNRTLRLLLKDRERVEKTTAFRRDYVRYSAATHFDADAILESDDYSTMIVGSDQVWNPRFALYDDGIWFLKTEKPVIKVSYAASFGVPELPESAKATYKDGFAGFDAISVREETGAAIVRDLTGKEPAVVLDPVFLLSRGEWEELAVKPERPGYVLCYYMQGFPAVEAEIRRQAEVIAKANGLKVVNIGKRELARLRFWENNEYGHGPREFVGLFLNAEYVVTNSFHGSAFSVLFGKPLISVVDGSLGATGLSSRLVDLLRRIGREGSILDIADKGNFDLGGIYREATDFELLEREIAKSKRFLSESLSLEKAHG